MKIPKQAKKVFNGIIFDIYHWEQERFDGSKTTFEMLKRTDAVRIIPTQGGKIIINKETQPGIKETLGTFGGRIDSDESPLECAKRELLEEAGMKSADWELIDTYEPYYEKIDFTVHTYVAHDCIKEAEQNLEAGEKIEILLLTFEEFTKKIENGEFNGISIVLKYFIMKSQGKLEEFKKLFFK